MASLLFIGPILSLCMYVHLLTVLVMPPTAEAEDTAGPEDMLGGPGYVVTEDAPDGVGTSAGPDGEAALEDRPTNPPEDTPADAVYVASPEGTHVGPKPTFSALGTVSLINWKKMGMYSYS